MTTLTSSFTDWADGSKCDLLGWLSFGAGSYTRAVMFQMQSGWPTLALVTMTISPTSTNTSPHNLLHSQNLPTSTHGPSSRPSQLQLSALSFNILSSQHFTLGLSAINLLPPKACSQQFLAAQSNILPSIAHYCNPTSGHS